MRVNRDQIKGFVRRACSNIHDLNFNEAREGQVLARTMAKVKEGDKTEKKEVTFFVSGGFIKVKASIVSGEILSQTKEVTVYEMVPGNPPDLLSEEVGNSLEEPAGGALDDELWADTMFRFEMFERAYNLTLKVLEN